MEGLMEDKLLEQGIAVVALFGVSYYVIRLTNFLFRTLAGGLDEHKEITIKQIDALNQIRSTLCDLKQEMVKLHEQNRIYRDIDNTVSQRLQNTERSKRG
jgi:ribonuclease HI|tara:strand:+ start:3677 stop:3976 length:300 start_codon:yes stop_codon:yes gene_type:complete